ncbi:MAG: transketolase C-terminal domain-containing protein [Caldilineaceae bacterium]
MQDDAEHVIPLGKADIKRPGKDVTICTAGLMVHHSLKAAEILAADGIDVEVIDLRTLKPWDEEMVLDSVAKTGHFVAVDESYPVCGAASEWAATVAEKGFRHLKAPVRRVSSKPVPIPFSPILEKAVIPSVEEIVDAVRGTFNG